MGANTLVIKKTHKNEIQWQVTKSERKNTEIWKAKENRQRTPTWAKAQDTRASPNSLETHLGSEGTLDTNWLFAQGQIRCK